MLLERYTLGRNPHFRNGRDTYGPIFPIGYVDPRLPVHEDVIGAVTASGKPVAFQHSAAFLALRQGKTVEYEHVSLRLEAGGIRAVGTGNIDLAVIRPSGLLGQNFIQTPRFGRPSFTL